MDNIEKLYKNYEILSDAGDKIEEFEAEYREILEAVKGTQKEKRLASQLIGKFFKHFKSLAEAAIDAQLDLCEDEDIQIRRQAIKDLPQLCKDTKEHTAKIGDILAQLLVVEDPAELQQVSMSLITISKLDIKGALTGIFSQIVAGDEATRDRCFKFIASKIFNLGNEVITRAVEDFIIEEIKKILQDVTADEFHLCMNILGSTRLGSTESGHLELINLAIEQAELEADIDAITIDDEIVERFIQCANHAIPYFSAQHKSTPFLIFVCDKLLPLNTWNMIATTEQQDQVQLRLLKIFAEMSLFCGTMENASKRIEAVYTVLLEYMPLPQLDEEVLHTPSFQFSHTECLLYALHTIGKFNSEGLAFMSDPAKLKDFRSRLQFLARGTQGYIKKLQEAVKGKTGEELKTEENQLKLTALKTTSNISSLIRDLFHSPPSFKTEILLSWVNRKHASSVSKRHAPITFNSISENSMIDPKKSKPNTERRVSKNVYIPPSGKYSNKVINTANRYQNKNSRNGRPFRKY